MIKSVVVTIVLAVITMVNISAAGISVSEKNRKGAFPLVSGNKVAELVVPANSHDVVKTAAELFSKDVCRVTGETPRIVNILSSNSTPIIVGTLGKSNLVDSLATAGKIESMTVAGKWETYGISVVKNPVQGIRQALVIYGSDPRGTAYGLMELSRMIGVSPWYWWADVTPRKKDNLYITAGQSVFGPPSVKYRGIFINDEDWGLQPWAAKHMDSEVNDIGPKTYEKVFELMLRCKANLLWPAMHPCTKAFWYYKENPKLAKKYDIVLGSSHCEQMLRNNVDEWTHNFPFEYGKLPGKYSWKTNSATIEKYWNDRVAESKDNDAFYTLGMRGIHDSGLPGYPSDSARRDALIDIIGKQRAMLEKNLGVSAADVPQVFCPYKEALKLYRLNLNLPEDVTLLWVDDNFSYIRQLSNPEEQKRKGGGGVYYHFSYWGIPQDYLWLGGTPPALTVYELMKAYEMNCKDMWVYNVGDIKPIEYEMQYGLDFAWDVNSFNLCDADRYGFKWGAETFGNEYAQAIYEIKRDYSQLASGGKPEHVNRVDYSFKEKNDRLVRYHCLVEKADSLAAHIPADLQDAYFQLISYPVKAASSMNDKVLGASLSYDYANAGNMEKTLEMAQLSKQGYWDIVSLTEKYNKQIANGKWDGMMDYAPRGVKHFYEFKTAGEDDVKTSALTPLDSIETRFSADAYSNVNPNGKNIKTIKGIGESGVGLTVWPLDMQSYNENTLASAPYAEFMLPVKKGENNIEVRCLPTFPIYTGLNLRYAISINGKKPHFVDIKTEAETKEWSPNVMQGYTGKTETYTSAIDGEVPVRIFFTEPGLVLTSLSVKE